MAPSGTAAEGAGARAAGRAAARVVTRAAARAAARAVALVLAALALAAQAPPAQAETHWSVSLHLGGAWNARMPLTIRQSGEDDLHLRARYATRPFKKPLYYVLGIERAAGEGAWALELIHHKLYLTNPPPAVQGFSITHGYNLVTLSRIWTGGGTCRGIGAGLVIAHPENTVRGQQLAEDGGPFRRGYYLAGPALSAMVGKRRELTPRWFASAAGRLTLAYARVPVAGGHAGLPNVALHAQAGIGYRTR